MDFNSFHQGAKRPVRSNGKQVLASLFMLATLWCAHVARAADGDLDTTFSGDGKLITDFGVVSDAAYGVAIQSDGKIVVVGSATVPSFKPSFALARYNTDGTLDTSFSDDGIQITSFDHDSYRAAYGYGVAIQSDGKIVVAGSALSSVTGEDFAVARYNTDGSLDTTFSDDGKQTTDFGYAQNVEVAFAVTLQSDGKIVLAGRTLPSDTSNDFALVRYNTDGTLDTSFSDDGKQTTDFNGNDNWANAVTVQNDGKIVAAGYNRTETSDAGNDFALARYNTDGSLDTTFSDDGKQTTDFNNGNEIAYGITVQSDNKIVIVGQTSSTGATDFALARYNSDGSLDTSFSDDGKQTTDFDNDSDFPYALTTQSDDKIVVVGYSFSSLTGFDFAIARYNTNGNLDTSFSDDGKQTTNFGGTGELARAVAMQDDGKIVVAGFGDVDGTYHFAVARYIGLTNKTPVANDDTPTVDEDNGFTTIDVLSNDNDADTDDILGITSFGHTEAGVSQQGGTINPVDSNNDTLVDAISYAPPANFFGTDSLTYFISDGKGGTSSATVTITVNPVNDEPSFTAGENISLDEDTYNSSYPGWATNLSAGPQNESEQQVTFIVTNDMNALFATQPQIDSSGNLTFSLAENQNGIATVTVKIKDNGGTANGGIDTSALQTFTITANPINDAPVANAGPDQDITQIGTAASVTLDGSNSSDLDSDSLTYTWRENGSTLASGVNPTVQLTQGLHTIELTVSDGQYSSTDIVVINVFLPPSTFGSSVNGNGFFKAEGSSGQVSFFAAYNKNGLGGSVNYADSSNKVSIVSKQVTSVFVQNNIAQITGTCKFNGVSGYSFTLTAYDYIPTFIGRGDRFTLEVSNGFTGGGTFSSGDVKVMAPQSIR